MVELLLYISGAIAAVGAAAEVLRRVSRGV
ncbi:hypothetical protein FB564_2088 [Salinispora arenicola]|uniref:Uncharacterized protein n=1 Tax=Salinispora arenicola TaxID=168697 RepID=A0A542XM83_SALAC|nr:hypothetical protein FB564_2088 [Salinispora arenicola]